MSFPTWRTLKLRTYQTVADFRAAITASGAKISPWAEELLKSEEFRLTRQEEEVELEVVSNADLGRPDGCEFQETVRLAAERGLYPCPKDTGPQLREAYRDQPLGEWLIVVSEPISDADGNPGVFDVGHGSAGRLLCRDYADPATFGDGGLRFVFRRRK
mgnify:CR=1 FL=1